MNTEAMRKEVSKESFSRRTAPTDVKVAASVKEVESTSRFEVVQKLVEKYLNEFMERTNSLDLKVLLPELENALAYSLKANVDVKQSKNEIRGFTVSVYPIVRDEKRNPMPKDSKKFTGLKESYAYLFGTNVCQNLSKEIRLQYRSPNPAGAQ